MSIKRLLPRHFKILELCLEGFDNKTIAQALGISTVTVSSIINAPLFQHELSRRRRDHERQSDELRLKTLQQAKAQLENAATQAVEKHISLMEHSEDERVQLASAKSILDRVFHPSESRDSQKGIVLNADSVKILQVAIKESLPQDERRAE